MMFIVVKEGVYMHGVFGYRERKSEAIRLAKRHASMDSDDYHTWEVYQLHSDDEAKSIFWTRKNIAESELNHT
jgi:hypothetical protein